MAILATIEEISDFSSVNEKKIRELLSVGVIPSVYTGSKNRKRYYTTDSLIEFAGRRASKARGKEFSSLRESFLEKDLSRDEVHTKTREKAEIITVSNLKGGVGKTTDAINISVSLAKLGQRVLIVDIDAQAQSSKYFKKTSYTGNSILSLFEKYQSNEGKVSKEDIAEKIVRFDNFSDDETGKYSLDVLPSEIWLTKKLEIIRMTLRPERILKEILSKIVDEYDFIVIDTPPYPGLSLELAFFAADKIVIATEAEEFSVEGMEATIKELSGINAFTEKDIVVDAIFVNQFSKYNYQLEAMERIDYVVENILKNKCHTYIVKAAPSIVGSAQAVQLPIMSWKKKPREALSVAEPFFDYAIKLIEAK